MNSNRILPVHSVLTKSLEQERSLNHQGDVQHTTGAPYTASGDTVHRETVVKPPIVQETVKTHRVVEVQPVIHREVQQTEVHHIEKHFTEKPAPVVVHQYPNAQGLVQAPLQSAPLQSAPLQSAPLQRDVIGPVQHATLVKPHHYETVTPKLTPTPAFNAGNVSKRPVKKWPTVISASEELHMPSTQVPREVSQHAAEFVPTVNEIPLSKPIQLGRVVPSTNVLPSASAPLHMAEVVQPAVNSAINKAADIGQAAVEAIPDVMHKTAEVVQPAVESAINTAADVADVGRAAAGLGQAAAGLALHKAADVVLPAASSALNKAADIGHATAETTANAMPYVADVGRAAAGLGQAAAGLALHKAADVGQGALNAAADMGQGALHAAAGVGQAAAATTANVIYKAADFGQAVAGGVVNKAADLGHRAADLARAAASGAYNKAAGLGNSVIQGVDDYVNHYISAAQRTWLKGQEEIEKLRRQTDDAEHWAMLNAFKTAECMRGHLEQANRPVPLSGRNADAYWAKLLENVEMRRRCAHPTSAQKNASKIVGMLMNTRFNPHSDLCIAPLRLQHVQKKLPSAVQSLPSVPAHQQNLASHSTPVHEDHLVSAPRSMIDDNLQAPALADLRAHHVPVSAVNATPFVPPAGASALRGSGNVAQSETKNAPLLSQQPLARPAM